MHARSPEHSVFVVQLFAGWQQLAVKQASQLATPVRIAPQVAVGMLVEPPASALGALNGLSGAATTPLPAPLSVPPPPSVEASANSVPVLSPLHPTPTR